MVFRRKPRWCHVLASAIALFFAAALSAPALATQSDPPDRPLYDVVAVGWTRAEILLATPAKQIEGLNWRLRRIRLAPDDAAVRDVVLSPDGSLALVQFADGTSRVFDLTEHIDALEEAPVPYLQHRLPGELFPSASGTRVCLLDDLGRSSAQGCTAASAAAVHQGGRVLYALPDGHLVLALAGRQPAEQLPYRLPQGAQWKLLAGHLGDAHDFLVVVTQASDAAAGSSQSTTTIVDPRHPDTPLGQYADPVVAGLRAQLEFAPSSSSDSAPASSENELGDEALATLAEHLHAQAQTGPDNAVNWSFFRVTPNPSLYAPILEFAQGEPDYPADVDIWQDIAPLAKGKTREDYLAAYASMGDRRWSRCSYYVKTLSYPRTWLIEFWYYYPFDEGKPHPHFHDSEHLFVEVDKLGGTVRNIFASDHDSLVSNNTYSTLVKEAEPVGLPLFAMVELAKHAMAPDLDHDGKFTPGVDDNVHPGRFAFWGLRDKSSATDAMFMPYRASFSLPRDRQNRFALAEQAAVFPGLDVPTDHEVCGLRPFPLDPPCPECNVASAATGITRLVDHPDAGNPEEIYKPYVFPYEEIRVGAGIYDRGAINQPQLYTAFVGDMQHLSGGILNLHSRLAFETMWAPQAFVPVENKGPATIYERSSEIYTGARLERFVTGTQGFYVGVTPDWAHYLVNLRNENAPYGSEHWQYEGLCYRVGYVLELPTEHEGNFTNQIGFIVQSSMVRFEWRVSFGVVRWRGRHDFGASPEDPSPY